MEGEYNSDTSNGTLNPYNNKESEIAEQVERLREINKVVVEKEYSRVFSTGAKRDSNNNKPYVHNLLGYTRLRFGYHMRLGANKYGDNNWLKGLSSDCYLESIDRHLASYLEGDRSEDHLSAIIFGIQGCMINEKNEDVTSDYYFNLKQNNDR